MSLTIIKEKIYDSCVKYVNQRKETALQAIASVQSATEEDTKSSAGDKYETGREMMKQEIERHQQLLAEAQQMEQVLTGFGLQPRESIGPGSLVQTDQGLFYLAIGIGRLLLDGEEVFVLSPSAPVGRLLSGKRPGDTVSFNSKTYQVLEVC